MLDGATWDYGWTGEGNLATAAKNGLLLARMTYDADGQRARKVYSPANGPTVDTIYIGNMYEKRTYSDGSPARHTIHLLANGLHVHSVTRAGAIATAFNDVNGWRADLAAASLYDARQLRGAALKLVQVVRALGRHPSTTRVVSLAAFALLVLAMVFVLVRTRHPDADACVFG